MRRSISRPSISGISISSVTTSGFNCSIRCIPIDAVGGSAHQLKHRVLLEGIRNQPADDNRIIHNQDANLLAGLKQTLVD